MNDEIDQSLQLGRPQHSQDVHQLRERAEDEDGDELPDRDSSASRHQEAGHDQGVDHKVVAQHADERHVKEVLQLDVLVRVGVWSESRPAEDGVGDDEDDGQLDAGLAAHVAVEQVAEET